MFIGHLAVGFAGKKFAPNISLAALLLASIFADVLGSILVAAGIERARIVPGTTAYSPLDFLHIPWSHSLLMLVVYAVLIRVLLVRRPEAARVWPILAVIVLSHWVLDFITHRPDMPLYPGSDNYGLGLWNNVAATMALEIAMFLAGVALYARATRALDRIGRWAFVALAAVLVALFVVDARYPAASIEELWISNLVGSGVILVWAAWLDRHRKPERL